MSTKIYNGIKFKSSNIKEVLDQLIQLKKVANKLTTIAFHNLSKWAAQNNAMAAIGEKFGIAGIKRAKAIIKIIPTKALNFKSILLFIII